MEKSALIMMGGAMRSSYGGGFLHALRSDYGLEPDILIGTSGNAANACYFASGQSDVLKHLWCESFAQSGVVNPLRFWRIFDVDRLIDRVLKQSAPLDVAALARSATTILIPITDADTGETHYVRPQDTDPYELLRAAKAVPVFYRRRITLSGKRYLDGEVGPTLADHVREAESRGATRILIMNNGWPDNAFRHLLKHMIAISEPHGLRERMLRDFDTDGFVCVTSEKGARITCIFPRDVPARFIEWRSDRLCASFEAGARCAHEREADIRATFARD